MSAAFAACAIVLMWCVLWSPQLFRGRVFVRGDAAAFRMFADASRERWLRDHQRTHFSPYVFAGLPTTASLADPRPQWLPDALLDLWEAPGRQPTWPPLLPELLLHLASMFAAGALARALWRGDAASFAVAALAWGMATYVALPVAYGHDAQFVALAWMPVALLAAHGIAAAATTRGAVAAALGLASALGLLTLAGHPQYVLYAGALVAAFSCQRAWTMKRPRRLLVAFGAIAGAAALSAAVWLPALLYRAESVRATKAGGVGMDEVARWSLAGRDAWSFLWPGAVGFGGSTYTGGLSFSEYPPYLGLVALALVFLGAPRRRDPDQGAWWFWAGVALLALALAFGTRLGALYTLLYERVPLWSSLRVAVASVVLAQLAVALLAARGMARIATRIPALALTAVVLLLVLDFGRVTLPVLLRGTGDRSALKPPPPSLLARAALANPHVRIAPLDKPTFLSNDAASWRVRSIGGLHGSAPRAWNTLRERNLLGRYAVMCALGIGWVASDTLALDDREMFAAALGAPGVKRVVHALPRAYGVTRIEAPGNEEAVLAALATGVDAPDAVAYANDARAAGTYEGSAGLALRWVEDGSDAIELAARAPAPAFVVVADAWFPGWSAFVDGARVPLYRVNAMLRGVAVPAGDHRLRLTYEPEGWSAAVALSRAGWALVAAAAFVLLALHSRKA